jgi:hypothetical protein
MSPDLNVGFSSVPSGTTKNLYKVRFLRGQFVAVGDSVGFLSDDGVSWKQAFNFSGYGYTFNDIAYDEHHGRIILVGKNSSGSGLVYSSENMASPWSSISLSQPLYSVSLVGDSPIIGGGNGYAALGTYNNGSAAPWYTFSQLDTGLSGDILAMAWTDDFVGSLVCEDGTFGLSRFSGGMVQELQYSPIPLALSDTPGIVQPDNATLFVGKNGTLSAMAGSLETERYITNCILEAYGDIIASFGSTSISIRAGTRMLIPNGRNPNGTLRNIDYSFSSQTSISVPSTGQADSNRHLFIVYNPSTGQFSSYTNGQFNVIVSTTTPTISPLVGNAVDWFNPDDNLWKRTTDGGTSWSEVIQMPIARYDCSSSAITAVRGRKVSEMLNNFDAHRMAGWPMPSDKYIDITYGVAGDTYVAPDDGWIYVECMTFNTNAYIVSQVIINEGSPAVYGNGSTTYSASRNLYLLFPVGAGYSFRMYNSNLNVDIFRFIYAKGAL